MSRALLVPAALICLLLNACGSSNDSPGEGAPPAGPPSGNTPPPVASQIAIDQPTVLLPQIGAAHQLTATSRDAQGATINAALTWISSNDAAVSVDATGRVTARRIGSARITANAGAVVSSAVLVVASQIAAGVRLLTDAQIVSEIRMVDPAAPPAFANQFEVTFANAPGLRIGDVVLGSEGKTLQGRVLMLDTVDAATVRVRLELVALPQLFETIALDESIDLAQGPVEIPAAVAALYDVVQDGVHFTFTPKAAPAAADKSGAPIFQAVQGTSALAPFGECEFEPESLAAVLPVALKSAPSFALTLDGSVRILATPENGIEKIEIRGKPSFETATELKIVAAFGGKVECTADLVRKPVKAPGWIGLLIGGEYTFGVGFELQGSVNIASASIGASASIASDISAGFVCAAGGACSFQGNATAPKLSAEPTFETPDLNEIRLEPSLLVYGFVSADLGNPFVQQLQFKALEAKVGPKFSGSFTLDALQIDDANYKSDYKLQAALEAGVGAGVGDFLTVLGLSDVDLLKFEATIELGRSPAGVVTADQDFYITGDSGEARVVLEPDSTTFTAIGPYNVKEVLLVRQTGGVSTETLARASASAGQTEFTLPFTAPASLSVDQFYAFVVTKLAPFDLMKLEIDHATGPPERLNAAGGTFNDGAASLQTAVLLKLRGSNGAPPASDVEVTITGAAGWNNNTPSVVSYPANGSRQFYFLPPAPLSGTYQATALIDGASVNREFTIDAAQQLAQPIATIDFSSPGINGVDAAWEPVPAASSYLVRVFDTTAQVILQPVDITAATSSHLSLVLPGAHENEAQIIAFNNDMRDPESNLPAQFNVSLRALPITMSLTLTPSSITLSPAQVTQFQAVLVGLADTQVIWSAGAGTMTQDGAHSASDQGGAVYPVTATSAANPSLTASATVSITSTGCYDLAGDIRRVRNSSSVDITISEDASAFVTLRFCSNGSVSSVAAITGTATGAMALFDAGTGVTTTNSCAGEFGVAFPHPSIPGEFVESRYSGADFDAGGVISFANLFGALEGACTSTGSGASGPFTQVLPLGQGASVIENGRIVAIDFNVVSSDGETTITGRLLPTQPIDSGGGT